MTPVRVGYFISFRKDNFDSHFLAGSRRLSSRPDFSKWKCYWLYSFVLIIYRFVGCVAFVAISLRFWVKFPTKLSVWQSTAGMRAPRESCSLNFIRIRCKHGNHKNSLCAIVKQRSLTVERGWWRRRQAEGMIFRLAKTQWTIFST